MEFLSIDLKLIVEQRSDCWAAKSPDLGITVYADTGSAAITRMTSALEFLKDELKLKGFMQYLGDHDVAFDIIEEAPAPDPRGRHGLEELQEPVELPIKAFTIPTKQVVGAKAS